METMNVRDLATGRNVRTSVDTELVDLIRESGILHPLLIYKQDGEWIIKEGHRRFEAALVLGLTDVPVTEVPPPASRADDIADQIVLNNSQKPFSYLDTARAFNTLKEECGWSQVQIARKFGLSEPQVSLALATLRVHPKIQEAVNDGKLQPSAVEPLCNLPMAVQDEIADAVVAAKTVRKVQQLVTAEKKARNIKGRKQGDQPQVDARAEEVMAVTMLEDALANMAMVKDEKITSQVMRERAQLAVKQMLEIAERMLA